jgi:hypothetical protein
VALPVEKAFSEGAGTDAKIAVDAEVKADMFRAQFAQ